MLAEIDADVEIESCTACPAPRTPHPVPGHRRMPPKLIARACLGVNYSQQWRLPGSSRENPGESGDAASGSPVPGSLRCGASLEVRGDVIAAAADRKLVLEVAFVKSHFCH